MIEGHSFGVRGGKGRSCGSKQRSIVRNEEVTVPRRASLERSDALIRSEVLMFMSW